MSQQISRRNLLKSGLIAAAATIIPCNTMAAVKEFLYNEKALCIYNLHTKEYVDVVFWRDGNYIKNALKEIDYIFRDHYNGSVKSIDRRLVDFLYAIQQKLQSKEPFHLISGYRSPATNRKLRKRNRKVAKKSMHIKGKAADIRVPGHKVKELRKAAYELRGGGVGFYPRSNFVHIDAGRVRFWNG